MPTFTYSFTVNAPLDAVTKFHRDTRTLKQLNPPPIIVQLHRVDPMAEGSISEFTLWLGPVPIRWRAVHSQVGPEGFRDTQENGPMASWQHNHRFEPMEDNTTRIQEQVTFRHHKGIRGLLPRLLFNKISLQFLFHYRKWATQRALGGKK